MPDKGYSYEKDTAVSDITALKEAHELNLLSSLAKYPEVIKTDANNYEPHQLAYYLKDLANDFHTYYNANQFLVDDKMLRNARLALIDATRQVIDNGLSLLGVSAPEKM